MIELNPELAERAQIFRDRIEVPQNDASSRRYRPSPEPSTGMTRPC